MSRGTKKDLAYDYIKRRIRDRRLLPGQRITASQIAEEIGTSVLPVREALLLLEAERLVTNTPYVGAVVAWVSHDEVLGVVQTLGVLEGYATRSAHPSAERFVDTLEALNERLRAAVRSEMWGWFIELNRDFHFAIYDAAGNAPLLEAIRIYWSQLDTLLAVSSFHLVPGRTAEDLDDHDELIRLLRDPATDPWTLERAARKHRARTEAHFGRQPLPVEAG